MRKKLCVAGCSFSDYTEVDVAYGEILAKKLDYDYIHEGAGCGSNYRIWRRITKHILDGVLTPNDLLIVQYTGVEREEVMCNLPSRIGNVEEPYDLGVITRFKMFSHSWQYHPVAMKFHKLKEEHFTNAQFDLERFNSFNFMFQSMLLYAKIPTIFIRGYRITSQPINLLKEHENFYFDDGETEIRDRKYDLTLNDWAHLNQEGHYVYADLLYNHIKSLDIS